MQPVAQRRRGVADCTAPLTPPARAPVVAPEGPVRPQRLTMV